MKIVAAEVHVDEPCYGLQEVNRIVAAADGSRTWHRVQAVYVVRGDTIAEHVTDMGSAFLWEHAPIQKILADGELTVGQMRDEAEKGRYDDLGNRIKQELRESSTLIPDFINEKERNWKVIRNQSVFGPGITRQRNGFPYHETHEQAKAQARGRGL